MSHFTVMVIGENPKEQLAPYQENNSGDCPKKYMKYRVFDSNGDDHWFESKADYIEKLSRGKIRFTPDRDSGYYENPNAKWDWYSLGGRWAGFFTVKKNASLAIQGHHRAKDFAAISGDVVEDLPSKKVDMCYKRDIDIESMKLEARVEAIKDYQEFLSHLDGEPLPPKWVDFSARFENINDARREYNSLKSVQNINKGHYYGFDDYLVSEDEFVQSRVNSIIRTHAVIKDGHWYERGEMGWWGVVHNEKDSDRWGVEFNKLFNSLPDDTLISVFDCHI